MKTSNIIGILILIVLIGGGTYLYFQNQSLKNQLAEQINLFPSASSTQQEQTTPTPTNKNNQQTPPSQNTVPSNTNKNSNVPVIQSISPSSGPIGTQVTLYGTGFKTDNSVYIVDGAQIDGPAFHVTSINGTSLTFTINASEIPVCNDPGGLCHPLANDYFIIVDGSSARFTITPGGTISYPITLQSISPASGSGAPGTLITIQGFGSTFASVTKVLFNDGSGDLILLPVSSNNGSVLTVTIPSGYSLNSAQYSVTIPTPDQNENGGAGYYVNAMESNSLTYTVN